MLKASRLQIGADCAVGADSVVLYDSVMEDGARLDALSLLMKGETLPAGTVWAGIPAEWQDRAGAGILETMREPSALPRGDSAALRLTSARPGPSPDILVPLAE